MIQDLYLQNLCRKFQQKGARELLLVLDYIYCNNMQVNAFTRPHLYYQKGWVANKFQVKNTMNAALRWKKRNVTQTNPRNNSHNIIQTQTQPCSPQKPATATHEHRNKMQITQSLQKIGANQSKWEQFYPTRDSRYSNFRATISNRKQLLYLKPYTRYRNNSMTIDQKKTEIYKQINNPDLNLFSDNFTNQSKVIEQPFTSRAPQKKQVSKSGYRKTFNVLKQKLRQRCEPSVYQSKITAIKFQ